MELVIIGYGNMIKAILGGLLRKDKSMLGIDRICVAGRAPEKIKPWLTNFFENNACGYTDSDISMLKSMNIDCDNKLLLLGCKAHNLREFSLKGHAHIVYSVLAGVGIDELMEYVPANHHVLIMPNIGAMYSLSSSSVLWYENRHSKDTKAHSIRDVGNKIISIGDSLLAEDKNSIGQRISNFVNSFGNCVFVETQKELNATIATNGSSPAILALVAQSLINAGVHQGLRLDASIELTQKTFEGIAELLKHKSTQEIRDSITSPGGTTAEALLHCDKHGIQGIITEALTLAVKKANGNH